MRKSNNGRDGCHMYVIAVWTRSRPNGLPQTGPRSQYARESLVIPRLSAKLAHNNKHPSSPNLNKTSSDTLYYFNKDSLVVIKI